MKKIGLLSFLIIAISFFLFGCSLNFNSTSLQTNISFDIIAVNEINPIEIDASDTVTITSSDESVLTIDGHNMVGVAKGIATITITCGDLTQNYVIEVVKPNLDIKSDKLQLDENAEVTLESLAETNLQASISFDIVDTSIVSITDGKLKGLKAGNTKIKVSVSQNNTFIEKEMVVDVLGTWPTDEDYVEAVYLGIYNYGRVTSSTLDSFKYRFFVNDSQNNYEITKVGAYELQNQLEEGNIYKLEIENEKITKLIKLDDQVPFSANKTSSVVEGKVEEISAQNIKINGTNYQRLENTKTYKIEKAAGGASVVSAEIKENDNVIITLTKNAYVKNIYKTVKTTAYTPVTSPTPGERTLTNFFKTAFSAVGHALYVYGGAWDFQDAGSSNQARSIGVASSWVEFFYEHDATYNYKNTNQATSYYPFGSYNEYYYAGVDCSGFVGWIMYNVMNTESGHDGYVMGSTKMAKHFAELGLGTYTRNYSAPKSNVNSGFNVGDIISCDGHVWICLGVCSDGSMVIIHSTPSESRTGSSGGGAQLGAIGSNENCEAYKLADKYNKTYYPD
ncbi:MAG: CHAP domain-containing protein, partial [Bacilli bacterium]|nr:CHAP domain-containing protein [Bacilli bacterium]